MTRRYAEGWFYDRYWLRPIDTLLSITRNVLTRFLDSPLKWEGRGVTESEKTGVINRLKQIVNESLTELSQARLWRVPQPHWQRAYGLSGGGSTRVRRQQVRDIFQHHVPIPESVSDPWAQEWIEEVKKVIAQAIEVLRSEHNAMRDDQM
jgi:hypothetical protein